MGDRRGRVRDAHAGGLRVPRDRLLAGQERRHRGGEGPDELLDRGARVSGRAALPSPSARARSSATPGSSCATTGTRRRRSRSWASPTRPSRRNGSSSSSSAPSRWRSCGARRFERIKFGVVRHLRRRLRGGHLSDRLPLGVRRRLAAVEPRHAGLRRFHGGPPDRRHRRARGAAPSRTAARQVRP